MSFQTFKSDFFCGGGRHPSATINIYGDITSKCSKVLIGFFSMCIRKKSMTVIDIIIQAKTFNDFFKNLGKKGLNVTKNMAKNVFRSPGRTLKLGANVGSAFSSRSLKQFYHHYQK